MYAKYNAVDSEVDQRACQDVICGESAVVEGKRVLFQDLVSKEQERVVVDEVYLYVFLLCFVIIFICIQL
jgi:hypothetical protein